MTITVEEFKSKLPPLKDHIIPRIVGNNRYSINKDANIVIFGLVDWNLENPLLSKQFYVSYVRQNEMSEDEIKERYQNSIDTLINHCRPLGFFKDDQ